MDPKIDIQELDAKIQAVKKAAEEIRDMADNFPAVYRNSRRLLASVKMIELNVSDIKDLTV